MKRQHLTLTILALAYLLSACSGGGSPTDFRIQRIDGPSSIVYGTSEIYDLYWAGTPVFPVTAALETIECPPGVCPGEPRTGTFEEEINPMRFKLSCSCLGGGCQSFTAVVKISLEDAGGRVASSSAPYVCRN